MQKWTLQVCHLKPYRMANLWAFDLLIYVGVWCKNNVLSINGSKSNIVHFRNPSVSRSAYNFNVNDDVISYANNINIWA